MNDFTLNELENLGYVIDKHLMMLDADTNPCDYIDLGNKIQAMIDNYCDHKKKSCMSCGCYSCDECENNE